MENEHNTAADKVEDFKSACVPRMVDGVVLQTGMRVGVWLPGVRAGIYETQRGFWGEQDVRAQRAKRARAQRRADKKRRRR